MIIGIGIVVLMFFILPAFENEQWWTRLPPEARPEPDQAGAIWAEIEEDYGHG